MSEILGSIDISFGHHHNTKYGLDELVEATITMCDIHGTATSATRKLRHMVTEQTMSNKTLLNMYNSISEEDGYKACRMMLDAISAPCSIEMLSGRHHIIGVDEHNMERFDKDMMYLIYAPYKNGTCKFESYATMQIVGGEYNPTLDCERLTRLTSRADFMRKFTENLRKTGMLVDSIVVDRGYYSAEVMRVIHGAGYRFIMPAKKNGGIKKVIHEIHEGNRGFVSTYTLNKGKDDEFTFTLVATKSKKFNDSKAGVTERYHVFATNIPPEEAMERLLEIPEVYRLRWGIETRYRQVDDVHAWTTSKNHVYRMILFYLAVFMCNAWAEIRLDCGIPPREMTLKLMISLATLVAASEIKSRMPDDPGG